jgi:hypothetical protein
MKFLDKVIVHEGFYEDAKGIILDVTSTNKWSQDYNREAREYLVRLVDWPNFEKWIDESYLTKVDDELSDSN